MSRCPGVFCRFPSDELPEGKAVCGYCATTTPRQSSARTCAVCLREFQGFSDWCRPCEDRDYRQWKDDD